MMLPAIPGVVLCLGAAVPVIVAAVVDVQTRDDALGEHERWLRGLLDDRRGVTEVGASQHSATPQLDGIGAYFAMLNLPPLFLMLLSE